MTPVLQASWQDLGREMHDLAEELFPLHRSITGDGVRATFGLLKQHIPLQVAEVVSGTRVLDWEIPQEWRIRDACIADASGKRIVDYRESNLHVVNYSQPVDACLAWNELEPHIHVLPDQPGQIPYRTAYFRDAWGFCVNWEQFRALQQGGPWRVSIDSQFFDGSLSMAEYNIRGQTDETILFYAHCCHPSLANDNISGMVVATYLAKMLANLQPRYSYRFVFAPATIGAIAWLAGQPRTELDKIQAGLVLSLLGDAHPFTYKRSRRDKALIDRIVPHLIQSAAGSGSTLAFSPFGYDERQFCSPGFDLPVGRLTRSVHGEFREYHTSADDLSFVTAESLGESLRLCAAIVESLEANTYPVNKNPCGEVQLGKRQLYRAFGEHDDRGELQKAMMWVLNQADGQHDLLSIAERAGIGLGEIRRAAELLTQQDLLENHFAPARDRFNRYR